MDQTDRDETPREESFSLLDLIAVITKHRRFIFFSTVSGAIFILIFSAVTLIIPATSPNNPMPNRYTPEAQVRLLESQSGSLSSALQNSALGTLATLAGGSGAAATGPSNAELAMALLKGSTLADDVTEHFNFVKRYHISRYPKDSQRKIFESDLSSSYDKTTGILTIAYTNVHKNFATDVLSYTLDALQKRFNTLSSEKLTAQKDYLGARLEQLKTELQKAQDNLVNYQVQHGIIDIAAQAQNQVSQIAQLNSQIQSNELQLETLKRYGRSNSDPSVVQLRNNIQIEQNLINELKTGSKTFSINNIPQDQLPRVSATYTNLKNDLTLQETIYTTLRQQYETAKLEANANSKMFEIIERPQVPELKSGPSRSKLSAIITITVFFVAVFITFIIAYFEHVKRDPVESAKLNEIKGMLRRPPKR